MEHMDRLLNAVSAPVSPTWVPAYDPAEDIRAFTLEGENYHGQKTKFFAYYGVPKNTKGSCPAMVLVHGGGGHAYHCWIRRWMERGYAAVAMDTTGFMPVAGGAGSAEGDNDQWSREWNGDFAVPGYGPAPTNENMKHVGEPAEEQWMFHALSAVIRSHTFLRQQPEVDAARIGITGISWGGVITSLAIGIDTRFAFAVPIYGSGYMAEGMGSCNPFFQTDAARREWLAERRFDHVTFPVLWLAWNDDCAFSARSNTLSYDHTVKQNPATRLAFVNRMMHSHHHSWIREESYFFADSVVKNGPPLPALTEETVGNALRVAIAADPRLTLHSATLYYITEPMSYRKYNKFGTDENVYMEQEWQTLPLTLTGGAAVGTLPADAAGHYVEVLFTCGEQTLTVTTGYRETP